MTFWRVEVSLAGNELGVDYDYRPPAVPNIGVENQLKKSTDKRPEPPLPIFSILDSIDFSEHFLIIGDVGTGKSTVTPIHEYKLSKGRERSSSASRQERPATLSTTRSKRSIQNSEINWRLLLKTLRSMSMGGSR